MFSLTRPRLLALAALVAVFVFRFNPALAAHAVAHIPHAIRLAIGGGGVLMGAASGYINANVDNLLRNDLDMAYEDMAFGGQYSAIIGLFEKRDVSGDAIKVPLKASFGGGQSGNAATAYANATLAGRFSFLVTPFKTYGMSVIPNDQDAWTKGDNSVVDLLLDECKTAMDSGKMQFDQALGGDGSGTMGTIVSSTNPSGQIFAIVLNLTSEVNHFNPDQVLVQKTTPFAGTFVAGVATVTAVNQATKTITVLGDGTFVPGNTNVLGLQGTMLASTGLATWPGIPGWIPPASARPIISSSSNKMLFGVDRSINEQKLAGSYLDGAAAGLGILEGINQLAHSIADVPGAEPDMLPMSFAAKGKIVATLQTQRRYMINKVKGTGIDVFYDLVQIDGPKGLMSITPSSNWPSNLVGILTSKSWVCGSPGNKPFVPATSNGNPVVEIPGQDQCVAQYRVQAMVFCEAPGHNGMLTIKP
jgi:hypothetical protein